MNIDLTNEDEKLAFLSGLKQYLNDKGKVLVPYPRLAGCKINLHDLYNKVTALGGYQKVTDRNLWLDLLKEYKFTKISATLSYGLKIIYQRFLEEYERVHYFGDDEGSKKPRFDFSIRINRRSNFLSEFDRRQLGLGSSIRKNSSHNYDRLAFSLMSCLPNEVDFAINACTLLSGESRHVLRLSRCPQVLEALLLHAGVASEGLGSLAAVAETWLNQTRHDLVEFWQNTVDDDKVLEDMLYVSALCRCNKSIETDEEASNAISNPDKCSICCLRASKYSPEKKKLPKWSPLFQSTRSAGVQDYEGQRVLQIALVLLNLSFEEFNVCLLACSKPLVRFAFLCIHSNYSALRQTGLDIMGNISSKMDLLSFGMDALECMYKVIDQCILSPDKFDKVRGYEILGNLCRSPTSKDCVVSFINDEIYASSIQLLALGDVELMLAALDALYHMSKLGEETCTKIMLVSGSVDTLVCLITLNVRALGSDCLSKIRIVKRIPPSGGPASNETHHPPPQHQGAPLAHSHHPAMIPSGITRQPSFPQHQVPQYTAPVRHLAAPLQPPVPLQAMPHAPAHVTQPRPAHFVQHSALPMPHQTAQLAQQQLPVHPQFPKQPVHVLPPNAILPQQNSLVVSTLPQHIQFPAQQIPQNAGLVPQPPHTHAPPMSSQTSLLHVSQVIAAQKNISISVKAVPPQPPGPPRSKKQKGKTKNPEHKKPKSAAPSKSNDVPVYTHKESQLQPPVYHYMPAPPSNIAVNKTPESFAQLWVWANFESCANDEGSTPRVEVFAEYAAAATRYGTEQVLPATEFGKCLLQVFPQAASRLFKDLKGQPLYHITGIRKRPTPFPVPGHHLQQEQSNNSDIPCKPTEPNKTVSTGATSSVANDVNATSDVTSSGVTSTTTPLTMTSDTKPFGAASCKDTPEGKAPVTTSSAITSQVQTSQCDSTNNCVNVAEKNDLPNDKDSTAKPISSESDGTKMEKPKENNTADAKSLPEAVANNNDSVTVNHCSKSVDSQTFINNDHTPMNHCDAIKSDKVNGSAEPLKEELVKTEPKTTSTFENAAKPLPEDTEEIKCNGDLSSEEKNAILKQHNLPASEEKVNHHSSKQLINGLPEETKSDSTPEPQKNGNSHKDETESNGSENTLSAVPHSSHSSEDKVKVETPKPIEVKVETPKPIDVKVETVMQEKAPTASKRSTKKRSHSQSSTASNSAPPAKIHKLSHPPKSPTDMPRPPVSPAYVIRPHMPPHSFFPNQGPPLPNAPVYASGPSSNPPHGNTSVTQHIRHPISQVSQPAVPAPQQPPLPSKLPVIDLMAPNASLLVLLRNSGKYQFDDSTDEKEDPISKSIRLTAVLILINICLYSNEGRSHLQRHETWLAYLSMSSMDCSPVIAKLLAELDR